MSEARQDQSKGISLPIDWHSSEEVQSRYVNNVLVQAGLYEIVVSFFEIQQPVLLGQPEENRKRLEELGSVRAECVSKLVISPEFIPNLIDALKTGLESYRQSKPHEDQGD